MPIVFELGEVRKLLGLSPILFGVGSAKAYRDVEAVVLRMLHASDQPHRFVYSFGRNSLLHLFWQRQGEL